MDKPQLLAKANPPTWLKILVIIIIGLGIFFRFAHLGQKTYCCDESWTSVAILVLSIYYGAVSALGNAPKFLSRVSISHDL